MPCALRFDGMCCLQRTFSRSFLLTGPHTRLCRQTSEFPCCEQGTCFSGFTVCDRQRVDLPCGHASGDSSPARNATVQPGGVQHLRNGGAALVFPKALHIRFEKSTACTAYTAVRRKGRMAFLRCPAVLGRSVLMVSLLPFLIVFYRKKSSVSTPNSGTRIPKDQAM